MIIHVSTRACHIHCKRGVTEVLYIARFCMSYGRCAIPGSTMVRSEGLPRRWESESRKKQQETCPLHASGAPMAVLRCLDYP